MPLDLSRTMNILMFKGTVSIISSDPPCKDGYARFRTVPPKPYSDQKWGKWIFLWVSPLLLLSKKCASQLRMEKPQLEKTV